MIPARRIKALLGVALGLALVLLLACTPSHNQSTFDTAGPVAEKQLVLFLIIFWVAVVVFVVVGGILLYAVIRFRRRAGQDEIPVQTHGNTALEVGWTIAPAVVLAVIAVPTLYYIFDIADLPADEDALVVNVTGHQWWWEFGYPEQELVSERLVTANELHVPVNTDVKLNLRSDDVIHSFWIPKLAGKVDVVPSNVNPMKFKSEEIGTFFGLCAEFCGVAHSHMRFRVIVESEEDFKAWVATYHELAKRPAPTGDSPAAKGAALFPALGCTLCHTVNGPTPEGLNESLMKAFTAGSGAFPGPNLTNLGSRETMAAGLIDLNRDNVMKWIRSPDEVKEGNRMEELASLYTDPELNKQLTEANILALAEYLLSLK